MQFQMLMQIQTITRNHLEPQYESIIYDSVFVYYMSSVFYEEILRRYQAFTVASSVFYRWTNTFATGAHISFNNFCLVNLRTLPDIQTLKVIHIDVARKEERNTTNSIATRIYH